MYALTLCMGLNFCEFESFCDFRSFSFVGAEWIAKALFTLLWDETFAISCRSRKPTKDY